MKKPLTFLASGFLLLAECALGSQVATYAGSTPGNDNGTLAAATFFAPLPGF